MEQEAEITIASTKVPWEETYRFGILNTTGNGRVIEFQEKPKTAPNNLASMGIYLFNPEILKEYLWKDQNNPQSSNDFGKDIIPMMLRDRRRIFAYPFRVTGWTSALSVVSGKPVWNCCRIAPAGALQPGPPCLYCRRRKRHLYYTESKTKIRRSMVGSGCRVAGNRPFYTFSRR